MKTLAALLLAMIAAVHYGADLAAFGYTNHDFARKGLYYVLRSFEGAAQYALIALLALELAIRRMESAFGWREIGPQSPARGDSAARSIPAVGLVVLVCGWGMVEHIEAGACRLAIGIENKAPAGIPLTGLCDAVTGLPMYALGLATVAFIAAVIAANSVGERKNG